MDKIVHKREFVGTVVESRMAKTIVVKIETIAMNKKYDKGVKKTSTYHVHDEKGVAKPGDRVRFVECRPLSKTKRWRLEEVIHA